MKMKTLLLLSLLLTHTYRRCLLNEYCSWNMMTKFWPQAAFFKTSVTNFKLSLHDRVLFSGNIWSWWFVAISYWIFFSIPNLVSIRLFWIEPTQFIIWSSIGNNSWKVIFPSSVPINLVASSSQFPEILISIELESIWLITSSHPEH